MNEVTKRVIKAYRYLYYKGIIKDNTDFCNRIEFTRQDWYKIKKGKRNFPKKRIDNIVSVFNINPDFVFYGQMPILKSKSANINN